jgi:hypothetical protein
LRASAVIAVLRTRAPRRATRSRNQPLRDEGRPTRAVTANRQVVEALDDAGSAAGAASPMSRSCPPFKPGRSASIVAKRRVQI